MLKLINYKHFFFFFIIALQMVIYNYPYIVKIEPRTIHAWRQYDCLSFAQNFYNNRSTFTAPCVNNLGNNGEGKAASDFPIVQFMVGNIWKVTGIHTFIYRLVNVAFLIFGLFFIYILFFEEFKNKIFAALMAALIFTSGNLSYYGISTISDIQSFSLAMIGFYFFYNWVNYKKRSKLIIFIVLFSLAGLLKASAGIVYILCLLYLLLNVIEKKESITKIVSKNYLSCLLLLMPFLFWVLWIQFAQNYNTQNRCGFFLVDILPVWNMETTAIYANLRSLVYNLIPQIINPFLLFSIFLFTVTGLFFNIKRHFSYSALLLCCLLFFILYIVLFFGALSVHDYYFINITAIVVIALFFIFKIIYTQLLHTNFKILLFLLFFMVSLNTYTSSIKTWKKINFNVTNFENSIVFDAFEQQNNFWVYWFDRQHYKALEDKTLDLEKIGVMKSDTILCLGDETINRSLYLLSRLGYTDCNFDRKNAALFVEQHKHIKYVVLIDSSLKTKPEFNSLFLNKIYEKESLSIYKIK